MMSTKFNQLINYNLSILGILAILATSCASSKDAATANLDTDAHDIWFKKLIVETAHLEAPEGEEDAAPATQDHITNNLQGKNHFLKNIHTNSVDFWITYLGVKNKERFQRFINNGEKYRSIIEETFARYDLPKELYFVGLIESGYYLGSKSHAGAAGPWQFIRSTGRIFNLQVNSHIDERRNIVKSTEAAAKYFKDLYKIFGSWELALAAYNKGENGVIRRIKKGKTRDYYKLSNMRLLPKETRNYIPKIIASMKIYQNLSLFGLKRPSYPVKYYHETKTIPVRKSMSISKLASLLDLGPKEFKNLNPELIGNYTPNSKKPILLRVPNKNYNETILASLDNYNSRTPASRNRRSRTRNVVAKQIHTVKRGDNLTLIARKYGTEPGKIKKINNLESSHIIPGQKIIIALK